MKTAEQRVIELEKQNKQLQKATDNLKTVADNLIRRLVIVEKQASNTYHIARLNEGKVTQLQNNARLSEGKVSKLQSLIESWRRK